MDRRVKLVLDIVMGAVIPILILNNLNEQLGTVTAYVIAALVPVAWVFIDTLFLTKRFNFITSYAGAFAIIRGLLAFWFVDGIQFALKDSVSDILTVVVFGGSIIVGKPIMSYFFAQALHPNSPKQDKLLKDLLEEPKVSRAIVNGTMIILITNVLAGVANFFLNLQIVVADFGTTMFNQQVAQVNAITRIALTIPVLLGFGIAVALIRQAIAHYLPEDDDDDSDFWDLLELREAQKRAPSRTTRASHNNHRIVSGFSGKVLIIGAGAAGLSAGHLLHQKNIEFQILEATSGYGGRMKKANTFADFPLSLGAEWLTAGNSIFDKIVNDNSVAVDVNTIGYKQDDHFGIWKNGNLELSELGSFDDRKFVNGTWFDFFEKYIVPSVSQHIVYNAPVHAIDYTGDTVIVRTPNAEYRADKVIVSVPLTMLQNGIIVFTPSLPKNKLQAINKAVVWDGIKVFLEFSEKFYPTYTDFSITPKKSGHITYFDASYGQNTDKNILGLFAVGAPAQNYISLHGEHLKNYILNELDTIFSNQATPNYINHIVQNWSEEPYIKGAYLHDYQDWNTVRTLSEPVADKVYFAGDAYTSGDDWGDVHSAAQAAKKTIKQIVH